jgi:hypothetical protein
MIKILYAAVQLGRDSDVDSPRSGPASIYRRLLRGTLGATHLDTPGLLRPLRYVSAALLLLFLAIVANHSARFVTTLLGAFDCPQLL